MAKLTFIYGTMGAGKSEEIIKIAKQNEGTGYKTFVLRPKEGVEGDGVIWSRTGDTYPCKYVGKDWTIFLENLIDYKLVIVDEAQFLTKKQVDHLRGFVDINETDVVCYGLRTNFKGEDGGFEGATRLLQVADEIKCKYNKCALCDNPSLYNARYTNGKMDTEGEDVVLVDVPGVEYKPLCSDCYWREGHKEYMLQKETL